MPRKNVSYPPTREIPLSAYMRPSPCFESSTQDVGDQETTLVAVVDNGVAHETGQVTQAESDDSEQLTPSENLLYPMDTDISSPSTDSSRLVIDTENPHNACGLSTSTIVYGRANNNITLMPAINAAEGSSAMMSSRDNGFVSNTSALCPPFYSPTFLATEIAQQHWDSFASAGGDTYEYPIGYSYHSGYTPQLTPQLSAKDLTSRSNDSAGLSADKPGGTRQEPGNMKKLKEEKEHCVEKSSPRRLVPDPTAPEFHPASTPMPAIAVANTFPISANSLLVNIPVAPRAMIAAVPAEQSYSTAHIREQESYVDWKPQHQKSATSSSSLTKSRKRPRAVSRGEISEPDHSKHTLYYSNEVSWTNSKVWVREQMRIAQAYQKMRDRAHHLGCTNSPFLPQSPCELVGHEAEKKKIEVLKMCRKIEMRKLEKAAKKALEEHSVPAEGFLKLKKILANPADGLSMILGMESCFNTIKEPIPWEEQVEWPQVAELKENGEERQKLGLNFGRFLPLPRKNRINPRALAVSDGKDRQYQRKEIVPDRWDWLPGYELLKLRGQSSAQIGWNELSPWLQEILTAIDDWANEIDMARYKCESEGIGHSKESL